MQHVNRSQHFYTLRFSFLHFQNFRWKVDMIQASRRLLKACFGNFLSGTCAIGFVSRVTYGEVLCLRTILRMQAGFPGMVHGRTRFTNVTQFRNLFFLEILCCAGFNSAPSTLRRFGSHRSIELRVRFSTGGVTNSKSDIENDHFRNICIIYKFTNLCEFVQRGYVGCWANLEKQSIVTRTLSLC